MTSLRRRLTLALLGALLPLLAAGSAGLYLHVRRALRSQFDEALTAQARVLSALVVRSGDRVELDVEAEALRALQNDASACFQLRGAGGSTIARSRFLPEGELPLRGGPLDRPEFWDLPLEQGRRGRGVGLRFVPVTEDGDEAPAPAGAEPVFLALARDRAVMDRPLAILFSALLAEMALLLAGAGLVVARVVRRGLRPLDRVADQAAGIEADSLGRRFPEEGLPSELAPVCRRLNDLLGRLEAAFQRERRFTSDAAHELRTPIAELRSLAEVALRFPGDAAATARGFQDALDVARHMERLVGALLDLARCDAGRIAAAREPVALVALVEEARRESEGTARARGLSLSLDPGGAPMVRTDPALARAIVANLVRNAVEHAPPGGRVVCRIEEADGAALCVIENTNDALVPGDLPHLFERFWRKDAARGRSASAGLGLSVVAAFARILGVSVRAELPEPSWFRVTLRFPLAASTAPAPVSG